MYINRVIDNMFKAHGMDNSNTDMQTVERSSFPPAEIIKRPIKISEHYNLPGIILTLPFVQTHTHKHAHTHTHTHTQDCIIFRQLDNYYVPHYSGGGGGGGHIVFSAYLNVGVSVASCLHSIS